MTGTARDPSAAVAGASRRPPAGTVFSGRRVLRTPFPVLPPDMVPDTPIRMDGLEFLSRLPSDAVPVAFLDPQYRGVLDWLSYGNEGRERGRRRRALQQMSDGTTSRFIREIDRVLIASGHLFLWVDKFHLCRGVGVWTADTLLEVVDLVTWDKGTLGMGYRTRRRAEYCIILQKAPRRAKGVWQTRVIADVVQEKVSRRRHPHAKPVGLQADLIAAVSHEGDLVIDPAAGSFSVMEAAMACGRRFLGVDLAGREDDGPPGPCRPGP